MEGQLRELIPFLRDRNPQVRQLALSNLLSQTPTGSPHRNIFFSGVQSGGLQRPQEPDVIRDLKLLCRDQLATAHDAFRALVNLSDTPSLVSFLLEPTFFEFLVSYIINPAAILADLASMLLSNLTASPAPCSSLLTLHIQVISSAQSTPSFYPTQSRSGTCPAPVPYPEGEPHNVLALPLLIDSFVEGAPGASEDKVHRRRKGELHFLASVFANLSTSPRGREFFLIPRPERIMQGDSNLIFPLAKIVVFTEHADIIRRGGVASTLKNCAFHAAAHRVLLSPDSTRVSCPPSNTEAPGVDVLPYLLIPLAGPEELDLEEQERLPSALQLLPPTKKREADPMLRLTHVETLILLSTTRWGRDYLRENGVYEIVRVAHLCETDDKVAEHIERLVVLLKSTEGPETELEGDFMNASAQAVSEDGDSEIEEIYVPK